MTTDCPHGNDRCPVVTGSPMKHGIDCQYCKTMLSYDEVEQLTAEQLEYLRLKRRYSPMRGGPAQVKL